jgi:hypothetical protein
MTYMGRVEKGVIVIDGDEKPDEGTVVRIEEVEPKKIDNDRSIWDALKEFDGKAVGLPPDMADNHDHYIHGTSKRRQ